ncbi:MAG: hypothetical protein R3351_08145, partial [Nitrospirales bacterium]|nr:hypothetical protein [Nitrospirales bacterium]
WQEREKASSLIVELNHKPSRAAFMSFELCFYLYSRDPTGMKQAVEELMKLSEDEGFLLYVPVGMMYLGWALAEGGNTEEGLRQMERGKDLYCSRGNRIKFVEVSVMYAEILRRAGRMEDALRALGEGMNHAKTQQEHLLEPELYRLKGEILRQNQGDTATEAEVPLQKAVDLSRAQKARWLELRATTSLCRLWQAHGNNDKARRELQQIFNWFTEGFDTKDLIEAGNLLQELEVT